MQLQRLQIEGLRCLAQVDWRPGPGLNVLVGANGVGKTSVLEAAFLLSHGRSFRAGGREVLLRRGAESLRVFAEVADGTGRVHRLGLGRQGGARWQARVNGEDAANLGELLAYCAVVCFEPGSHALISGPGEERRRFLDWGVFHVEHGFLDAWRRYQRALRQRNRLLKDGARDDALYGAWEREMSEAAEWVDRARTDYTQRWLGALRVGGDALLPELGDLDLSYRRGWAADMTLAEYLSSRRERDRARGHTTGGPHRADWGVSFAGAPQREHLSRGQEKLCALLCVLAQATLFADVRGEWPVVCLDDLASELDEAHQARVVALLQGSPAQVFVTGTRVPEALAGQPADVFHVEQGGIRALL